MNVAFRVAATAIVLSAFAAPPSRAAESYDSCTGFIDALPAVVSTQGVWCLRHDLATTIASGNAILVDANNVTIACNGFKMGGLSAGLGTGTTGILSYKLNLTVRGCNIRGFKYGATVFGAGSVIEDNRFEANTVIGINTEGEVVVRRNLILDTGGNPSSLAFGAAIAGGADFSDNRIDGVFAGSGGAASGIYVPDDVGVTIRGNVIKNVAPGSGTAYPINFTDPTAAIVAGNVIWGAPGVGTPPIACFPGSAVLVRDNTSIGFSGWDGDCTDAGSNWPAPP